MPQARSSDNKAYKEWEENSKGKEICSHPGTPLHPSWVTQMKGQVTGETAPEQNPQALKSTEFRGRHLSCLVCPGLGFDS